MTAVVIDKLPAGIEKELPQLKVVQSLNDSVLVLVPRYYRFQHHVARLAAKGANFSEIAGNGSQAVILVTALVPATFTVQASAVLLFEQPVLTRPQTKRVALMVPVRALSTLLNVLAIDGARLEHVYDY